VQYPKLQELQFIDKGKMFMYIFKTIILYMKYIAVDFSQDERKHVWFVYRPQQMSRNYLYRLNENCDAK